MNNYMMIKILLPLSSYKDLLKMHHPSLNDNKYALFFHVMFLPFEFDHPHYIYVYTYMVEIGLLASS